MKRLACCVWILFLMLPAFAQDPPKVLEGFLYGKLALPAELLDRLSAGIEFAFRIGAAKNISASDLYHAHLLYSGPRPFCLARPNAILLHSQEMIAYNSDSYKKRNIFLQQGKQPEVLRCSLGLHARMRKGDIPGGEFCTVDGDDLALEAPTEIVFIPATADWPEYRQNIRNVAGRKVLFVISGYSPKLFSDR